MTYDSWLRWLAPASVLLFVWSLPGCGNQAETEAIFDEVPACTEPRPVDANKTCDCIDGDWQCTSNDECTGLDPSSECSSCSCQDGEWACLLIDPDCTDLADRRYTCGETTTTPSGCECSCSSATLDCQNCPSGCEGPGGVSADAATCNTCDCYSGECTSLTCLKGCVTDTGPHDDEFYLDGDRFLNDDGCLTTCDNGQLVIDDQCLPLGLCHLEEYSFLDGESFSHPINFCDTCTCADGVVECVQMDCFFCRYKGHVYPPGPVAKWCDCESDGVVCRPPK